MENFEELKLSFPTNIYLPLYESINKLDSKITSLFIPEGNKYFCWFTKYNNTPICLLLEKNDNIITSITFKYASFSEELTKGNGTILYGTLIENSFYCELLYYIKGNSVTGSFIDKFINMKNLFQYLYFSTFSDTLNFYIPFMSNSKYIFESTNLPYKVNSIIQLQSKPKILHIDELIASFKIIKRKEYEDVYELWCMNNNCYEFYSTALVNDLKTSHFLKNEIFNLNIDYKNSQFLDEKFLEDLENNINEKEYFVGCVYILEFRKWKPIIKKNYADNLKNIQIIEKKNI
jgi:hypothetical protein